MCARTFSVCSLQLVLWVPFYIISVLVLITQSYTCPSECSTTPCTGDENPGCKAYATYEPYPCVECEDGYFLVGGILLCASCEDTFDGLCSICKDYEGCNTCATGHNCRYNDVDCHDSGLNFCYDLGEIIGCGDTLTDTDDTDDTDDTEETDDTGDTEDTDDTDDTANTNTITLDDLITTDAGIATFKNNGINGAVTFYNGHINISLDFSGFDFESKFGDIGAEDCFRGGIRFGVYDMWTHDSTNDRVSSACDSFYTGSRWDPWLACSTISGNAYCESSESSQSCVPNGGAWDNTANLDSVDTEFEYMCDPINYQLNPFVCEVGDLSGKYGELSYDSSSQTIETLLSSAFEADGKDLGGMSIVFRCHDNRRAFCAPFEELDVTDTSDTSDTSTETTSELSELFEVSRPWQNNTLGSIFGSKKAYFTNTSYVYLSWFGKYEIKLNSQDFKVPPSCGTEILYRIFDNTDCAESLGNNINFYDPTLTCAKQSNQFERGLCQYADETYIDTSEGYRCDDASYSYTCDKDDYANLGYFRFDCSPSDLSGKYGSIDISEDVQFNISYTGYDPLMIPMRHLVGKSVGLQCSKFYNIIQCAQFVDYLDDKDYDGTETSSDSSGKSNSNKSSSDDDTFGGIGQNVWWFLLVIVLLSIVPCVKWYKNRYERKGPASEAVENDEARRRRREETVRSASKSRTHENNNNYNNNANNFNNNSYDYGQDNYAQDEYGKYATQEYNEYDDGYNQGYDAQQAYQQGRRVQSYSMAGSVVGGGSVGAGVGAGGYAIQQGMEREVSIHERAKKARQKRTVTSMMN